MQHGGLAGTPLVRLLRREFQGYNAQRLRQDVLAGLTVGAVALPLALAFGVAGGASAAAGLVTAILAGLIIGGLGGAAFQISGPTGAMSAILISIAQRHGMQGVWMATLLAGCMLVALGLLRLGRYIAFIPSPVITGFTSGIALIIAIGQLDNVLGVNTPPAENALAKLWGYLLSPPLPDWHTLTLALLVMATMILLPRLSKSIPSSLVGIVLATLLMLALGWQVPVIGSIPSTIMLEDRLSLSTIPWGELTALLAPAVSIAALGAVESLLCASVGANMTNMPVDNNQELLAQGIGNLIIPFFGGVPATAAIARTSVAIKSGGLTRVTSFVHSGLLLLSALALGPLIGRVPLAALGGVLLVTAWRMNEWEALRFYSRARLKHALLGVLVTMLATAWLDLTQAILIGIALSALIYLRQSAGALSVSEQPVDAEKLRAKGHALLASCPTVRVFYLTGPIFFGSVQLLRAALALAHQHRTLIISMRGVPLIDAMGVQAIEDLITRQRAAGGSVLFCALQPAVRQMFQRTGLLAHIGEEQVFWSADQAIMAAHQERLREGCHSCKAQGCELLAERRASQAPIGA